MSLRARAMQQLVALAAPKRAAERKTWFPECPSKRTELTVPTSIGPTRVVAYAPSGIEPDAVHVNFHGGGFILPIVEDDDPLCRFIAANVGVAVLNVDYVVAPQHPFPAAPKQAYEVVQWAAQHSARVSVGGQSAGGSLAAAVARQALQNGGPQLALQVLHYPPLDLVTPASEKRAAIASPMLKPWMSKVFDAAYAPDPQTRFDPLISPAHASDVASLKGIAPALVITAGNDLLRDEGVRYAQRLRRDGALIEHLDVQGVDHGYDLEDPLAARPTYEKIAAALVAHLRR